MTFQETAEHLARTAHFFQTPARQHSPMRLRMEAEDASSNAPGPNVVNGGSGGYWEALRNSPDRTQLPYLMNTRRVRHPVLEGLNRVQLAALGRYLVDNGGTAAYGVGLISNYSTPVFPQAASDDNDWNSENEDAFAQWGKRGCDFSGRFSFTKLQELACKAIDTDGDVGAAVTLKRGFPQVRFYETFDIGSLTRMHKTDGVLYDGDGTVMGYNVVEGFWPNERERKLSTDEMILLYDADRYCQYRGFSPFRRGSNDLRDANDIKGFEKLATKIASALAGVIKGGTIEPDVWGDDSTGQAEGGNAPEEDDKPSVKKLTLAELLGGDIPVIEGEFQQVTNGRAGGNVVEFLGTLNGMFASGLELPPSFFLDEKLTGPNIRGVLSKAQKKFNKRICTVCEFVEFVYLRFTAWRIYTKQIQAVPGWWKVTFQLPPKLVIDLGDQMSNEREDVLCGQMSRQERCGNRGRDWMRDESQISTEQRFILKDCIAIANEFKLPVEVVLQARGFMASATKPKETKGTEGTKGESGK